MSAESIRKKGKLIILSGPTAAGKTGLSIQLAKKAGCEIISADSMQVYKGMDIGTAKIKPEEMEGIRHHLIDIISPFDPWSVSEFKNRAMEAADEIYARGNIPLVVGGTGFYIQALLYDVDFTPQDSSQIRQELTEFTKKEGPAALHERLMEADPVSAAAIHENNVKRTMRALEFYLSTGMRISEHNEKERARQSAFDSKYYVLTMERDKLYERIDARVDMMLEEGLLDEVKALRERGCTRDLVSMQGLGYKEMLSYLEGEISLDEAVRILKRDTRHFAKRQLTWFRRERDVIMINSAEELFSDLEGFL